MNANAWTVTSDKNEPQIERESEHERESDRKFSDGERRKNAIHCITALVFEIFRKLNNKDEINIFFLIFFYFYKVVVTRQFLTNDC